MILLDTHIWLWWLWGSDRLSAREKRLLDSLSEKGKLAVSIISLWELEILERKGKIRLTIDFEDFIRKSTHSSIIRLVPLDVPIIIKQRLLPDSFHSDPADRLIAATALYTGFPLATKDQKIINSGVCDLWKG